MTNKKRDRVKTGQKERRQKERKREREKGRKNRGRGRDEEKRSENYRRGCILSFGRVHQRRYFFSFLLPSASSSLPIPLQASCSYNPQITNLTPERLKDQALFEVDSKEVIPAQDLARIRRKKLTKER